MKKLAVSWDSLSLSLSLSLSHSLPSLIPLSFPLSLSLYLLSSLSPSLSLSLSLLLKITLKIMYIVHTHTHTHTHSLTHTHTHTHTHPAGLCTCVFSVRSLQQKGPDRGNHLPPKGSSGQGPSIARVSPPDVYVHVAGLFLLEMLSERRKLVLFFIYVLHTKIKTMKI